MNSTGPFVMRYGGPRPSVAPAYRRGRRGPEAAVSSALVPAQINQKDCALFRTAISVNMFLAAEFRVSRIPGLGPAFMERGHRGRVMRGKRGWGRAGGEKRAARRVLGEGWGARIS